MPVETLSVHQIDEEINAVVSLGVADGRNGLLSVSRLSALEKRIGSSMGLGSSNIRDIIRREIDNITSQRIEVIGKRRIAVRRVYDSYVKSLRPLLEEEAPTDPDEEIKRQSKIDQFVANYEFHLLDHDNGAGWGNTSGFVNYLESVFQAEQGVGEFNKDPSDFEKYVRAYHNLRIARRQAQKFGGGVGENSSLYLLAGLEGAFGNGFPENFPTGINGVLNKRVSNWRESHQKSITSDESIDPSFTIVQKRNGYSLVEPSWVDGEAGIKVVSIHKISGYLDNIQAAKSNIGASLSEEIKKGGFNREALQESLKIEINKVEVASQEIFEALSHPKFGFIDVEEVIRDFVLDAQNLTRIIKERSKNLPDSFFALLEPWATSTPVNEGKMLVSDMWNFVDDTYVDLMVSGNYPNEKRIEVLGRVRTSAKQVLQQTIDGSGVSPDSLLDYKWEYLQTIIDRIDEILVVNKDKSKKRGALEHPSEDAEKAWRTYIEKMLESGNTVNFQRLRNQVEELMLERLGLREESHKYGRRQEYFAYSKILGEMDVERYSHKDERKKKFLEELKIKAAEMEKVRTITDVAHLFGHSNSMSSDWKGFVQHEGSNGLMVGYYDYYWNVEGGYKHAEIVRHVIDSYLEWLRSGEGKKWDDGPIWKKKARDNFKKWANEKASQIQVGLSAYDLEEIDGLVYNITYGLGIRQHAFIDQFGAGATPSGGLGDNSEPLQPCAIIANDRYSAYKGKGWRFLRLFGVPKKWADKFNPGEGSRSYGRWSNINEAGIRARELSKKYMILRANDRGAVGVGINPGGRWDEQDDEGRRFRGEHLATSYDTLFEWVYLRSEERQKQAADNKRDSTFRNFMNGFEAFKSFKEHILSVPGGLSVESVENMDPEDVVKIIISDLHKIIQKDTSYLKKNIFSVNFDHVSWLYLDWIDRAQALLGLCEKGEKHHAVDLLHRIREEFVKAAENLVGLGDGEKIFGVEGYYEVDAATGERVFRVTEPLAYTEINARKKDYTKDPDGIDVLVVVPRSEDSGYGMVDFILNRIAKVALDTNMPFIPESFLKRIRAIKRQVVGTKLQKERGKKRAQTATYVNRNFPHRLKTWADRETDRVTRGTLDKDFVNENWTKVFGATITEQQKPIKEK